MSRYRKTDVRMWNDEEFRRLSKPTANGQSLFHYCLTGPFTTNIPGLFSAGEAAMAERLGWSLKDFRKAFQEVSRKPLVKADWDAHLVFVPNAIKYNVPENPNVIKGWADVWDELPECALKVDAYQTIKAFLKDFREAFGKAFEEACRQPSRKQEQEQEQEQEPPLPPKGATTATCQVLRPEAIQARWNSIPGVRPCTEIGKTIRGRIWARLREYSEPEWWTLFFQRVQASDFLCGRTNGKDGPFHASLDWVLGPKNLDKILAGNYDSVPMNGHVPSLTCTKRVQGPDDRFLRDCGQPASPLSRPNEPRCPAHLSPLSQPQMVSHANN